VDALRRTCSQSCVVTVVCPDAPIISLSSTDVPPSASDTLIVVENATLTLSCTVNAYPPVDVTTVTWYKDAALAGLSTALVTFFYRAMLCIARTMLSKDVCPSVTRRYSVETAKHIIKLFVPSSSPTILNFPYQRVWQYANGAISLVVASDARGIKKLRFSTNISLYLGNDTR